ncbi:uncharacterized protein LOC143207340 [Lasioglossum baleicum]|uniref:uncharacterized protein LOC143207340 n=1 Tax=Lasioglossum baleicum TaxID=434251 RepID=UPI003FCC3B1D
MAPRIQTDYHSAQETNACSLRILKRSRKNVSQLNHVSASNVNGKEDFFRSLGLQMRRFQCPYPTLHGVQQDIKERTRSDGLKLRDCSVVILGATCNICGKCFKCETDLNVHVTLRHYKHTETVSTASEYEEDDSEVCRRVCEYYKCRPDKNSATKLQSNLRLIFRIGDEIVVDTSVERKHLKSNKTISIATQTESANPTELILKNNSRKGDVPGIDHTVFDNSPCKCCTATTRVANGTNRYVAGNFVEKYPTECEEITRRSETCRNDRLTSTCETGIFSSNSIPLKSDSESLKSTSKPTKQVIDSVTVTFQSHSEESSGSEKLRGSYTEKLLQRSGGVNTVQLMMPVILPIIVPHQTSSRTVANQHPSSSIQEQYSRSSSIDEPISDDEVQEVLRIVRGHDNIAKEINHESPNRSEQEMLARNVIKDMLRIEQQSWHLLEREDVAPAEKRRRTSMKFNTRNGVVDEITKKKKYVGSENSNVKTVTKERNVSKESFAKLQKLSHDKLSISENAKENVLTCNGNISIPSETLLQYTANYYANVCEINNNTETAVQEPVSCLFISHSAGIENISNRPTVIDLDNDPDE